jgi:hypothetical protein
VALSANGEPGLHEGLNVPSRISRVIALGFYDGATDGVLQIGEQGPVYRFEVPEEMDESVAFTSTERPFDLRPLPPDALDRLVALIAPYLPVRWPFWFVRWQEIPEAVKPALMGQIDSILAEAEPPTWRITTPDPWAFSTVSAAPRAVLPS